MHVAMHGRWREVVEDQLTLMRASGLYEFTQNVFIGLLGPDPDAFDYADDKLRVVYHYAGFGEYEFPTLTRLHALCGSFKPHGDELVYYLHTKGVFTDTPQTQAWRRYMQYFAIERHADCVRALADHDVCGVDWYSTPWPHFSGNFWWARADYVRTLSEPRSLPLVGCLDHTGRHNCERWVGSGARPRVACLFHSKENLYVHRLARSRYVPASESAEAAAAPCGRATTGAGIGITAPVASKALERRETGARSHASADHSREGACAIAGSPPLFGFMHVAMVNHWRQIVDEQILKMRISGLWERFRGLFIGLLGSDAAGFSHPDPKVHVQHFGTDLSAAELPTLAHLQQFFLPGHAAADGALVFYVHTKGAVHPGPGQEEWRRSMEHFVLLKYADCIEALDDHDVCGINWGDSGWCRMFRGNFWWARADYIRTLPDIRSLTPLPGFEPSMRHVCERWIGEGRRGVRAACLHNADADHYRNEPYPRSRYARLRQVNSGADPSPSGWRGLENRFQDFLEVVSPLKSIVVAAGPEIGDTLGVLAEACPFASIFATRRSEPLSNAGTETLHHPGADGVGAGNSLQGTLSLRRFANVVLLDRHGDQDVDRVPDAVDAVYLGSARSYRDLAAEFQHWERRLRPGGCVLMHGTTSHPDGVGRVFAELSGRKAEIPDDGGLGAWYKPLKTGGDRGVDVENLATFEQRGVAAAEVEVESTPTSYRKAAVGEAEIYGFMHVAMVNHWRQIVDEQILKMRASGLWEKTRTLHVGLLGPDPGSFPYRDPKIQLHHFGTDFEPAEGPTLAILQDFCRARASGNNGGGDFLVYYTHTKGVFNLSRGTSEWRRSMEHFSLLRHADCIAALAEHDVCGINWHSSWCRFFGGNFWWARGSYIRSLPDVRSLRPRPGLDPSQRHVYERWIGENPSVRPANLHDSLTHHYASQPYPRHRYARLREVASHGDGPPSGWRGLENRFQDLLEPIEPMSVIVEVGVEYGHSLFSLAAAAPFARIVGVDPYGRMPAAELRRLHDLGPRGVVGSADAEAWVRSHVGQHPNIVLIRATGEVALEHVPGPVDVLHLDAVHTYADVAAEFRRWEPKLRPGGCVLLHDTISFPDDVGRFFAELPGRKAEIRDCGGLGAWYKPALSARG
jgi:hypothetical protein